MNEFDDGRWIPSLSLFFQALDARLRQRSVAVETAIIKAIAEDTADLRRFRERPNEVQPQWMGHAVRAKWKKCRGLLRREGPSGTV